MEPIRVTKENRAVAIQYAKLLQEKAVRQSRENLYDFARLCYPAFMPTTFHYSYYRILLAFAQGKIKKLIVSVPPQHGKSHGASVALPAFMLGQNPELRIAVASYAKALASGFNRQAQQMIDSPIYSRMFPDTMLGHSRLHNTGKKAIRRQDLFGLVDHNGGYMAAGRGSSLTGKTVDIMIMDDLYRDSTEANSPTVRDKTWLWYMNVVRARLDNNASELIVFTRWHEDDIIGRLLHREPYVEIKTYEDLNNVPRGTWAVVNFEAIKESEPTEIDPRKVGEVLFPQKHDLFKLQAVRELDISYFNCLYQGTPDSAEGKLYKPFKEYKSIDDWGVVIGKMNYTDCADEGADYLCSICYTLVRSHNEIVNGKPKVYALITDVVYSSEGVEQTSVEVPDMLVRNGTIDSYVESNNGGRTFSLLLRNRCDTVIHTFHQTANKESRIMTNAGVVNDQIIMPANWANRWPSFYNDVTRFKRDFRANKHDDAVDALTGVIEKSIILPRPDGIIIHN